MSKKEKTILAVGGIILFVLLFSLMRKTPAQVLAAESGALPDDFSPWSELPFSVNIPSLSIPGRGDIAINIPPLGPDNPYSFPVFPPFNATTGSYLTPRNEANNSYIPGYSTGRREADMGCGCGGTQYVSPSPERITVFRQT